MGILIEGFDTYAPGTGFTLGPTTMQGGGWVMGGDLQNVGHVGAAYSRFGTGQGMRQTDSTGGGNTRYLSRSDLAHADFAFSMAVNFLQQNGYIGLCDSAGARQITVSPAASNAVTLFGNNTTLFTSASNTAIFGDWHTYRIIGKVDPSAGWLDFYIDSNLVYQVSGVDTRTTTLSNVSGFISNSTNNQTPFYADDMVLLTGADAAGGIPECRVSSLLPTSDGGTLNLTPSTGSDHYAMVDDLPLSLSDYLYGTADGELDLLNLADLSFTPEQIIGVQARMLAAKTDIGSRLVNLGVRSGGVDYDGADLSVSTAPMQLVRGLVLNPNTGLPWDKTSVDALQLYPKIIIP